MKETGAADGVAGAAAALDRLFREGAERLARTGRSQWLSLCVSAPACDALALFAGCQSEDAFYWEEPARGLAVAALGRVHAIETRGAARIEEAARLARELFAGDHLLQHARQHAADPGSEKAPGWAGPLLVGGFAFSAKPDSERGEWAEFGDGRLVLPELVYVRNRVRNRVRKRVRHGEQAWLTASCGIGQGTDLARAHAGLLGRLEDSLERVDAVASALRDTASKSKAPAAPSSQACWQRFPSALGLPDDEGVGPEYRVRSDHSHARYCAQVQEAREAIARGELEKVVLARSLSVAHEGVFDLPPFLDTLRRTYSSCATLAVRRARHCFVSASPERLVELAGGRVETVALAGTAPRGRSPEEDERIGRALRESKKDQEEHAIVKRAIEQALEPLCGELEGPETPGLMRVEGIQHLETPLVGRLEAAPEERRGVLDLVARLHPTPAVGGAPRAEGQAWIARFEGLDRGWYAGPVGFVTAAGEGSFRVALRSARICGGEARLFAGAGIVEASCPEDELRETRLKLRALLAPLTEI